ncbi:MAG: CpaF family protein [Raoultibacter sp.]
MTDNHAEDWFALKGRVHNALLERVSGLGEKQDEENIRTICSELVKSYSHSQRGMDARAQANLVDSLVLDTLYYGPITKLLQQDDISDIMVNGPNDVFIEKRGVKQRCPEVTFDNDEHILFLIKRIIDPLGRRCDPTSPMVDARLADGTRVNCTVFPASVDHPTITIRKFPKTAITMEALVENGTLSKKTAAFLLACVAGGINIVVSGGTGSGKTTLLNALSLGIPEDERVITIEDTAELRLTSDNLVRREARPANTEGIGEITIHDLLVNSLRENPDRIIVGECRDGAAFDMLQALNTGHDGSLTTIHANDTFEALGRLRDLVTEAGHHLPTESIDRMIVGAIKLLVHVDRLPVQADGSRPRKVVQITEITGYDKIIQRQDLFLYDDTRQSLVSTGTRPYFLDRISRNGVEIDPAWFRRVLPC